MPAGCKAERLQLGGHFLAHVFNAGGLIAAVDVNQCFNECSRALIFSRGSRHDSLLDA